MTPRTQTARTRRPALTAPAQATSPDPSRVFRKRPVLTRGRAWRAVLIASILPLTAALPASARGPAIAHPAPDPNKTGLVEKKLVPDLLGTMQKLRIPGAIVSVTMPKWGTTTTALGTDNLGTGQAMSAADHMRIGDVTRTFTGTVILQLAGAHKITLDEPVSRLVAGVPNGQHITVRQLLKMTSGLYDYAQDPALNKALDAHPATKYTPQALLDVAFKHQPYFAPGKGFHSSATDTVLLGMAAEHVTGQSLQTLFQQRIFTPLGMKDTRVASGTAIAAPAAHGYQYLSDTASLTAPVLTGKDAAWADYSAGKPADATQANASWTWASGAVTSTLADLNRWAPALATGKLLTPQMRKEQMTFTSTAAPAATTAATVKARPAASDAASYGLAVGDYAGFVGHDGAIPGYSSFVGYDPKKQATIVVLVNSDRAPDGTTPSTELTKRVLADVFGD